MLRPSVQIVLFSATFEDRVVDYATMFAPNANQITLKHEELTVEGIKQMYIDCANDDVKFDTLVRLYGVMTIGSSIIFVKVNSESTKANHQTYYLDRPAIPQRNLHRDCRTMVIKSQL